MDAIDEDAFRPYTMTPGPGKDTGLCLVFNNVHFTNPLCSERPGSILDFSRIEKVFRCFGFKVEEKRDCMSTAMLDCMRRTAQDYSPDHRAFVCFFLSHGQGEKICDRDGRLVPLCELVRMFVDHCPPHMADKPKLFFAQICRDSEGETGASPSPSGQSDSQKTAGIPIFPEAKDVLLGFATTSGREAYSCVNRGSPYIEKLMLVLRERGHKANLFDMLTVTRQLVETTVAVQNKDMCPCYISSLSRPLTFSLVRPDLRDSLAQEADEGEGRSSNVSELGLTIR